MSAGGRLDVKAKAIALKLETFLKRLEGGVFDLFIDALPIEVPKVGETV